MSSDNDPILMALMSCGRIEDKSTYTILKREKVNFKSSVDALKYERQIMKFADALIITVQELDNAVLNALKGNPSMSINELVSVTQSEFYKIEQSIARLIDKELLTDSVSGFKPTAKALEKKTEPIESDEIYTIYKYEVNEDKPSLRPGGKSRTFCVKMLAKKHEYDFEELDRMTNDLGTNVWDYRGGYYNNPSTGQIDPDCRHLWMAETRLRKKDKKK